MIQTEGKLRALNRAIDKAGGITKTAAALGVTVQAVQNWRSRGAPLEKAIALANLTGVALHRLRPETKSLGRGTTRD